MHFLDIKSTEDQGCEILYCEFYPVFNHLTINFYNHPTMSLKKKYIYKCAFIYKKMLGFKIQSRDYIFLIN